MTSLRSFFYCFFALTLIAGTLASAQSPSDVTTWHNDINRTGWQSNETILTPSSLTTCTTTPCFGRLWQWTGPANSGAIAAQPLAIGGLSGVSGCSTSPCNLVFIVTTTDKLYAFDASSTFPAPLWSADLAAAAGGSYVSCSAPGLNFEPCTPAPAGNTMGVSSTPVIDTANKLLYAVGAVTDGTSVEYDLFAVDLLTGSVHPPITIGGSVTGNVPGSKCQTASLIPSTITFNSNHRQRSALLLLNGNMVYVAFAPGDAAETLNGWIFGYKYVSGTFSQVAIFGTSPYGSGGGVWASSAGPSAEVRQDGTTYMYVTTGNGTFDISPAHPAANDIGDSAIKLTVAPSGGLSFSDYYTPSNVFTFQPATNSNGPGLCINDEDFGSGGVMVFPDTFYHDTNHNTNPYLSVTADKQSNLYVLNRDNLGHYNFGGGNLIQQIYTPTQADPGQGYWSTGAYWKYVDTGDTTHYRLYYSATTRNAAAAPYAINMYELLRAGTTGPIPSTGPTESTSTLFCAFSPTPSVSSNGTTHDTGVVWGIEYGNSDNLGQSQPDCNGTSQGAALHAFDATHPHNAELYSSRALGLGTLAPFPSPTVFNGRVYVGTGATNNEARVSVFGLCATRTGGCQ